VDLCGGSPGASGEVGTTGEGGSASRRYVLRRGAIGGAGLLVAGVFLGRHLDAAVAAPSKAQDQRIFNFALLLEYLQSAFYTDGVRRSGLRGEILAFAEIVSEHERQHAVYLRKALGAKARPRPRFEFGDATKNEKSFIATAVLLENLGVAAYNGQAPNLTKPALAAAAEIVSVEGRHAAWISDLAGRDPAPRAADPGASAAEVMAALKRTGFLKR
jgi:Ferritin-like domain